MNEKRIAGVLKKIAAGALSRADAAQTLECSERQVNRLMRAHGVHRPPSTWRQEAEARRERVQERRTKLLALAQRAAGGGWRPEDLAKMGGVSVRTLFRWIQRVKNEEKQGKTSKKR